LDIENSIAICIIFFLAPWQFFGGGWFIQTQGEALC